MKMSQRVDQNDMFDVKTQNENGKKSGPKWHV